MQYRIVDTVSGAHFNMNIAFLPQINQELKIGDNIRLTVVEFNKPNGIVVTSNASYDELLKAIYQ